MENPLLHPNLDGKSSTLLVQIAFALIGLASSALWNQLMLCVVVLTELYGKSALAQAATAQNAMCAMAMIILTFGQRLIPTAQMSARYRLFLCACSLLSMIMFSLGFVFASTVYHVEGAKEVFLLIVGLNGLCTGMSQNLAASISTISPGASGALLFGESMSPLVAVAICTLTELSRCSSVEQAAAWTLLQAQIFVIAAFVACIFLWYSGAVNGTAAPTIVECVIEGGEAREYVLHRVAQLICNAVVAFCCCCAWVFLLCSSPFIAEGLCGSNELCSTLLPQRMISISNMAATFGRLMGLKVGTQPWLPSLVVEGLMLLCFVLLITFACIGGRLVEASFTTALAMGLSIFGGLTLWSNFLLMRNDHSAQRSCGHSIILPCHVTTEVMWLAIQLGSIAGTCLAASL